VEAAEAALARAATVWVRAGHDVHAEQPEAVARVLLDGVGAGGVFG
jgi:pimeloyl-ACP methyl ester carboxylesterase